MLTYVAPFLLAAVSGLAYLAVKHPTIYESLFNKVYALSGVVFLALAVWAGATAMSFATLVPFLAPEKVIAARAAIDSLSIPIPLLLLAQFAVMAYLFLLSWLAHQVMRDPAPKPKE